MLLTPVNPRSKYGVKRIVYYTHTFQGPVFSGSIYAPACRIIQESSNE